MVGESKWRKLKLALGLNTCLYPPKTTDDDDQSTHSSSSRFSDLISNSSSSGLRFTKFGLRSSSRQICAICLKTMKAMNGPAIFTSECSHSFHFHCITSNVKHGNRVCPVCRAKWKDIPVENSGRVTSSTNTDPLAQHDLLMLSQGMQAQQMHTNPNRPFLQPAFEPTIFDDDEPVNQKDKDMVSDKEPEEPGFNGGIEVKTYPELSAVARSTCFENFNILINLKAPPINRHQNGRASIDLVTVLDISGSMSGTKIALLKQAMGFVLHNLGQWDRLSVVAFSSSAHRLFPLRHMTERGKQESLQMINSLVANGGTNIAEALRKGAKVMTDRKFKNPVSSMILLSDGQDTHNNLSLQKPGLNLDYQKLLPSIEVKKDEDRVPIHTFGFGMDHDACAMHFIAERSGGMFSFIESENAIQDAFAQCIGGLLSVVVQELRVKVECVDSAVRLRPIKAGSYKVGLDADGRSGFIEVGDLYAEEVRDFLVMLNIPVQESTNEMSLVKFEIIHTDPIKKTVIVRENEAVNILRPESTSGKQEVSIEVDRQRNRQRAAKAIADARVAAERGNLPIAMMVLDDCQKKVLESVSGRSGDWLCAALVSELKEMRQRMISRRVYESSGRAYVLSGLSSHSWQRATARGDSTELTSQIQSYQTQSMVNMVNLSQTMCVSRSPSTSVASPTAAPPKGKKSMRSSHSFSEPLFIR